jgi:hypothetical protein
MFWTSRVLVLIGLTSGLALSGATIYIDSFSGQFGKLDLSTGIYTPIGTTTAAELVGGSNGVIYAVDESGNWVTVNPNNGNTSVIGPMNIAVDEFASTSDGTIYATSLDHKLYTVNRNTGLTTLVGPNGFTDPPGGFLFTSLLGGTTAQLYETVGGVSASDFSVLSSTKFYSLSRTTGAAALIGPTGVDYFTCGILINGILYDISSNPVAGVTREFTINTATGAATPLFTLTSDLTGVEGIALLPAAVPEPASFWLGSLALGFLAVGLRRNRA